MRWYIITYNELPKPKNQVWTSHLFAGNLWLRSSIQLLMHLSHIQCKRHRLERLQGIIHVNRIDKTELEFY